MSQGNDLADGQSVLLHGKADIEACEGESIDPPGLALVAGTGVVAENAYGGGVLFFGQQCQQLGGKIHLQEKFPGGVGEAAQGIRVAVSIGDVGLDVENGDSVDVWSDRNLYWLTTSPLTNRLMFDLKADTTFHNKDILVLEADYSFLAYEKNTAKAVVSMKITFDNDSTLAMSKVIEKSGKEQLVLQPDSAYKYKSVSGFVYYSNPDSTDATVLINNIKLLRYREGSFSSNAAGKPVEVSDKDSQNQENDRPESKEQEVRVSDRKVREGNGVDKIKRVSER